jgi:hypothetical protein
MSVIALEPENLTGLGAAHPTGIAKLSKMMFDGVDLGPLWRELIGKYIHRPDDAAALLDLSILEQLFGNLDVGLARQAEALHLCRLYRSPFTGGTPALRLLAFAAPGDLGTNTPLEFLLEGSAVELHTLYVVPGETLIFRRMIWRSSPSANPMAIAPCSTRSRAWSRAGHARCSMRPSASACCRASAYARCCRAPPDCTCR